MRKFGTIDAAGDGAGDVEKIAIAVGARAQHRVAEGDGVGLAPGDIRARRGPVSGLVVRVASRGRRVLSRGSEQVLIEAEAGESWHQLVCWALDLGLSGIENLALIPGTVGAAPVQNIGAYGVELCDCLDSVQALDRQTGELCWFERGQCDFAYRDSRFKREAGRYVILRVRLRLWRQARPAVDYAPLAEAWRLKTRGEERYR